MAVSNKISIAAIGGGSSSKKNTTTKTNTIDTSYSKNLSSGITNPKLIKLPQSTLYMDNLKSVQNAAIGTGSGSRGGVTNEGAVMGNLNVTPLPTINKSSGSASGNIDTSYNTNLPTAWDKLVTGVKALGSKISEGWDKLQTYGQQLAAVQATGTDRKWTESPAGSSVGSSAGSSATPSVSSGTNSAAGDVDTYEEYLLKQEGYYKEQLDKLNAQIEANKQTTIEQAEQQRQQTEAQAEAERERGVVDARSSYAQNLATYGANAEQLAAMGLSGSGYSDYLNQQAYATQRAETQSANAQAEATKLNAKYTADAAALAAEQQANSDKLNAELSYAENLQSNAEKLAQYQQQKAEDAKADEEQRKQYFAALLTSANAGEYTSEQLASLAAQYGLDETQIAQLQAAADSYEQQKYADNYAAILDQMLSELPYYNDDGEFVVKEQDRNKMLKILEDNRSALGEQLYSFYKQQIENLDVYSEQAQKDDETAQQEEQQKEEDKQIIAGNETVEHDGKDYRLGERLDRNANEITQNDDFSKQLKELGYSDPFDPNIPNGTTLTIKCDASGRNRVGWEDFIPDVTDWRNWVPFYNIYNMVNNWAELETRTLTYYNGNWYFSSED